MNKSVKNKLIIYIIPFLIIALIFSYFSSIIITKRALTDQIALKVEAIQGEQYAKVESLALNIQNISENLSIVVGNTYDDVTIEQYEHIIKQTLSSEKSLRGIGLYFEPYIFDENSQYSSIYIAKDKNEIKEIERYSSKNEYDYFSEYFYNYGKDSGKSVFTNAYYDNFTSSYLVTNITPIYDNQKFVGCVTATLQADYFQKLIKEYNEDGIDFYIVDSNGMYLSNKDISLVQEQANILNSEDEQLASIANTILTTKSDTITYSSEGKKNILYYDTIPNLKWKLIYVMPQDSISSTLNQVAIISLIISLFILVVVSLFIVFITNNFVHKPINNLLDELKKITNVNPSSNIDHTDLNTYDEFSLIGSSLINVKSNLEQYQKELDDKSSILIDKEASLKDVMEYNQAIINALPYLVFIFTRDGYCIYCKGTPYFSSVDNSDYIGKHITDIVDTDDVNIILDAFKTIQANETMRNINASYTIDGVLQYFNINISYCRENEIMYLPYRVTDLYDQLNKVKYLNQHDILTGLYNRTYYEQKLYEMVRKNAFPLTVIVSDINGLKLINDSFGTKEGDNLILQYSELLKATDVDFDLISRTSGDEFAMILPYTDKNSAKVLVDGLLLQCSEIFTNGIPLSVSFGIGTMNSETDSLSEVLKIAEDDMYQHKLYNSASKKDNTIVIINSTLQAKNPREQLHSNRVAELCEKTAKHLNMSMAEQSKLKTAGLLHDIGKIGIPENLLNKCGSLTESEYAEICKHPEIGYRILEASGNLKQISEYILAHHEKWDGSGYPRGLKGNEIPLEARIIAIADTFDAITSERSYREALPIEYAIAELVRCKGSHFEPTLVDLFIENVIPHISS